MAPAANLSPKRRDHGAHPGASDRVSRGTPEVSWSVPWTERSRPGA